VAASQGPSGSRSHVTHIPELDGLRGIAILLVIIVHARAVGASIAPATALDRGLDFAYHLGWTGVDLFFVLSGFLITGILIDTKGTRSYFRSFYIRRFLRIFPLYYAALALETFVVFPLANHRGPWSDVSAVDLGYFWIYLANWRTGHGLYVPFVTHFWSLSVEEHFYFVWPIAVAALSFTGLLRLSFLGILTCIALRGWWLQYPLPPYLLYHWTPFRIEPLLVGAVGALAFRSGVLDSSWQRYRALALTLASATLVAVLWFAGDAGPESRAMQSVGYSSVAVIFGVGVYEAASRSRTGDSLYVRALRMPRLRNIGKVSYAMYICNGLFSWLALHLLARLTDKGWLPHLFALEATLAVILIFGCSYAAALASWRYFESPILALKETWAPYP